MEKKAQLYKVYNVFILEILMYISIFLVCSITLIILEQTEV